MKLLRGVALVGALMLGACGGDGGSDRIVRTGAAEAQQRADGKLSSEPVPLTLADLEKTPDGSARRAVMRLLFWAQWGNLPAVIDGYDPGVVARTGVSQITGAYAWIRPSLLISQPRILGTSQERGRAFVGIELLTKHSASSRESFVLRRMGGEWRIVFDSLLERAIVGHEQYQRSTDGGATQRAGRAGDRAAQHYRDAFLTLTQ